MTEELQKQIETAFDYRGHVTALFHDGKTLTGFLFNRDFSPKNQSPFVEFIVEGNAENQTVLISDLSAIRITGDDHAAGKSYQDWINKKAAEKNSAPDS